jgi:hypothetical protein
MKGQTLEEQNIMCGAEMGNQTLEEYKKTQEHILGKQPWKTVGQ